MSGIIQDRAHRHWRPAEGSLTESQLPNSSGCHYQAPHLVKRFMAHHIRIDGLKLSDELLQIRLRYSSRSAHSPSLLYRRLAEHAINVTFLSLACHARDIVSSCCVSIKAQDEVRDLIASDPNLEGHIQFFPSVGMVSLFPHQNSMAVLGRALKAFGKAHLPLYGMGSSLSSLTFITDYARLGDAAEEIEKALESPSNAPFSHNGL